MLNADWRVCVVNTYIFLYILYILGKFTLGKRVRCIGDAYLARYIYQLFTTNKIEPTENIIRELLITCVKRGSSEVSLAILNDIKAQNRDLKPSAFRIVFDIAQKKWDIAVADKVKQYTVYLVF